MISRTLTSPTPWALTLMLVLGTACSDEDRNYDWADGGASQSDDGGNTDNDGGNTDNDGGPEEDAGPPLSPERARVKEAMEAILGSTASADFDESVELTELVVTATRAKAFFVQFAKHGPALKIDYKLPEGTELLPGTEVSFKATGVKTTGNQGNTDILTKIADLQISDKKVDLKDYTQPISALTESNFKAMRYELLSDDGYVPNQLFKTGRGTQGLFFVVDGKRAPLTIRASDLSIKEQKITQFSRIHISAPLESYYGAMQLNPYAATDLVKLEGNAFALLSGQEDTRLTNGAERVFSVYLNQEVDPASISNPKDWTVSSTIASPKVEEVTLGEGRFVKTATLTVKIDGLWVDDMMPRVIYTLKAPPSLKAKDSNATVTPGLDSIPLAINNLDNKETPEGRLILSELVRNTNHQPNQAWIEIHAPKPIQINLQGCVFVDDWNQSVRVIPMLVVDGSARYVAIGFVEHGGTWKGPKNITVLQIGRYESWSLSATDQIELRCPNKDGAYVRVFKMAYNKEFPGSGVGEAAGLKTDQSNAEAMSKPGNWCVQPKPTPNAPTVCAE